MSCAVRCYSAEGGCLGDHVVELAVLGALDERLDLGDREDEGRALGEARVANRDLFPTGKSGQFDAVVALGPAADALAPGEAGELVRRDSVAYRHRQLRF